MASQPPPPEQTQLQRMRKKVPEDPDPHEPIAEAPTARLRLSFPEGVAHAEAVLAQAAGPLVSEQQRAFFARSLLEHLPGFESSATGTYAQLRQAIEAVLSKEEREGGLGPEKGLTALGEILKILEGGETNDPFLDRTQAAVASILLTRKKIDRARALPSLGKDHEATYAAHDEERPTPTDGGEAEKVTHVWEEEFLEGKDLPGLREWLESRVLVLFGTNLAGIAVNADSSDEELRIKRTIAGQDPAAVAQVRQVLNHLIMHLPEGDTVHGDAYKWLMKMVNSARRRQDKAEIQHWVKEWSTSTLNELMARVANSNDREALALRLSEQPLAKLQWLGDAIPHALPLYAEEAEAEYLQWQPAFTDFLGVVGRAIELKTTPRHTQPHAAVPPSPMPAAPTPSGDASGEKTCGRCDYKNQLHFRFCLGCGNELGEATAAPASECHEGASAASPAVSPRRTDPPPAPDPCEDGHQQDGDSAYCVVCGKQAFGEPEPSRPASAPPPPLPPLPTHPQQGDVARIVVRDFEEAFGAQQQPGAPGVPPQESDADRAARMGRARALLDQQARRRRLKGRMAVLLSVAVGVVLILAFSNRINWEAVKNFFLSINEWLLDHYGSVD